MSAVIAHVRGEFHRHGWMLPGLLLTGSAALGSALPDIIAVAHRVLG